MNLLFYKAVNASILQFPKIKINRRQNHNLSSARRFVLFFRYFSPGSFVRYIAACRRAGDTLTRRMDAFISRYGTTWSYNYFFDSSMQATLVQIMNSVAGGSSPSSVIDTSFGWLGTPEGHEFWYNLDVLFKQFWRWLDSNHITGDEPIEALDAAIFPALHNSRTFRSAVVSSLPYAEEPRDTFDESRIGTASSTRRARRSHGETVEESPGDDLASFLEEMAVGNGIVDQMERVEPTRVEQTPVSGSTSANEMHNIEYDFERGNYSYTDDHGERHTVQFARFDPGVIYTATTGTTTSFGI